MLLYDGIQDLFRRIREPVPPCRLQSEPCERENIRESSAIFRANAAAAEVGQGSGRARRPPGA